MAQCFRDRLVGVRELNVLADQGDADRLLGGVGAADELVPFGKVGGRRLKREVIEDQIVDTLRAEDLRHFVGVVDVERGDDCILRHAAEQGDLAPDVAVKHSL